MHARTRAAFLETLAARLEEDGKTFELALGIAYGDARDAAEKVLDAGPDLVLVAGVEGLRALNAANRGGTPILALSPDCTPCALPEKAVPGNVVLFSEAVWAEWLRLLHGVTGFARLGMISPPPSAPEGERQLAALLVASANEVGGKAFAHFSHDGLTRADGPGCREAVDDLFFDEIDALLLDGSGCFAPSRPDYAELMALLSGRGILPLSLADPDAARHGALVSPWAGNADRLGRELARWFFQNRFGSENALKSLARDDQKKEFMPGLQVFFSVNTATAASMGFDPPPSLPALAGEYVNTGP